MAGHIFFLQIAFNGVPSLYKMSGKNNLNVGFLFPLIPSTHTCCFINNILGY